MNTAASTILQLQRQRDKAEYEKRQALLDQAEMQHELNMLRAMRSDIASCLTDRRIVSNANRINKVARIVRAAGKREVA